MPTHERPDPGPPLFRQDLLAGRTALVTGGGTGIGFGIAACLARYGADVVLASRSSDHVEPAARRLREAYGRRALAITADVREPESIRDAVDRAAEKLGSLHILVNNAAGNFYCPTEELSPGGWRAVLGIDLDGTFHASRAAFPHMKAAGFGRIVSISMTLHYRGWPRMAHATAAKAGIDALTRTLALEWAPHGINVNAVAPGPVPTQGVRGAFTSEEEGEPDAFAAGGRHGGDYARRFIPAGRLGTPGDIGRMVTYLASPGGDWITGAIFVVDGGEWLQRGPPPGSGAGEGGGGR